VTLGQLGDRHPFAGVRRAVHQHAQRVIGVFGQAHRGCLKHATNVHFYVRPVQRQGARTAGLHEACAGRLSLGTTGRPPATVTLQCDADASGGAEELHREAATGRWFFSLNRCLFAAIRR
jgi:hypothetical protein